MKTKILSFFLIASLFQITFNYYRNNCTSAAINFYDEQINTLEYLNGKNKY